MGINLELFLDERLEKDLYTLSLFHSQDLYEVKLGEKWKKVLLTQKIGI